MHLIRTSTHVSLRLYHDTKHHILEHQTVRPQGARKRVFVAKLLSLLPAMWA